MTLLSLDPSSSAVGFAVLRGIEPADLVDAGLLRPSMARGALGELPDWLHHHLRQRELHATWRILSLVRDALELADEHQPDQIVIEIPSGLYGAGAKQGAKGSLTTYGLAAGAMFGALNHARPLTVAPVTERQWTRWRKGKVQHQATVAALYRQYQADADPGADVSDAIGLGRWWLIHHAMEFCDDQRRNAGTAQRPAR